jgi:hypothetical protein
VRVALGQEERVRERAKAGVCRRGRGSSDYDTSRARLGRALAEP